MDKRVNRRAVIGSAAIGGASKVLAFGGSKAAAALARIGNAEASEPQDMLSFIDNDLGGGLWGKQREIAESVATHSRTAVRSAHAIGKSHAAARIALAYIETHPRSIVITTAPTSRQVRNVLWRYMRSAGASARAPLRGRMLTDRYEIAPDWYALGFKGSDNNADAVQGFHAEDILVIVDEAAGVAESVMEGLEAILTGTGARLLLIGNPTSMSGTFRRAFHEDRHLYNQITISAYDTPNFTQFGITRDDLLSGEWRKKVEGKRMPFPALVDATWVERQINVHGADSAFVQSRVDAEFPTDADNVLIALSAIENAMAQDGEVDSAHQKYVGIDVARSGSDETAIVMRQGPAETYFEAWQGFDLMESVGKIRHLLDREGYEGAEIRVDVIGLGAGLADRLHELGYNVVPVNVAAASSDRTQWQNFRHEAWWQLGSLYREQMIWPAEGREFDPEMIAQLSDVRTKWSSTYTKPVIEAKDDVKKRSGRSPDRAEAQLLAYCTLPPIKAERRPPGNSYQIQSKAKTGWMNRK